MVEAGLEEAEEEEEEAAECSHSAAVGGQSEASSSGADADRHADLQLLGTTSASPPRGGEGGAALPTPATHGTSTDVRGCGWGRAAMLATLAAAAVGAGAPALAPDAARGQPRVEARGLWMGSSDPHGLACDVGAPPPPGKAPAVSMAAHVAASADELRTRAMPRANVAPRTPPLSPPPLQPAAPPVITAVEQLVPAPQLRLVRRWSRQLRRAFSAASRGDLSLARRLRPDDLWIEHVALGGAELWDWDLRPLECGLPAVPLPVSGRNGVLPATSLILSAVRAAAGGFDDQSIVSEMMHGVSDDSRCRRGTLLCAPHVGALRDLTVALERTGANVANGWGTGGHALPCWPLRTCPFSVVDESIRAGKPKFRLTTDLSWPHAGSMWAGGCAVDSVNGGMDRSEWPATHMVRIGEYAEALAVMQGGSPGAPERRVRAWSLDCKAFYRVVGRQRAELWRNGIWLPDGVQLDERCCFGDASAAVKCVRISNFLVFQIRRALDAFDAAHPTRDASWAAWQQQRRAAAAQRGMSAAAAERQAALHWVAMFVDDQMGGSADDLLFDRAGRPIISADGLHTRRSAAHFALARDAIERFGWESAPDKEQPPAEVVEVLGAEVDLALGRWRLADAKRIRYSRLARQVAMRRYVRYDDILSLLGKLTFAAQCYPLGKQHLHASWRMARARYRMADGLVHVSRSVAAELAWWASQLEDAEHPGVPLASRDAMPPPSSGEAGVVYADASGSGGFAAWTAVEGCVYAVAGEWTVDERSMLICELELLASTFGLVALAPWLPRDVYSFTDNTVAQAAMRRLAAESPAMQAILARRTHWMHAAGVLEEPRRISSEANLWADLGSRPEKGGVEEVERQARALGMEFVRVDVPARWRDTSRLRGDGLGLGWDSASDM